MLPTLLGIDVVKEILEIGICVLWEWASLKTAMADKEGMTDHKIAINLVLWQIMLQLQLRKLCAISKPFSGVSREELGPCTCSKI